MENNLLGIGRFWSFFFIVRSQIWRDFQKMVNIGLVLLKISSNGLNRIDFCFESRVITQVEGLGFRAWNDISHILAGFHCAAEQIGSTHWQNLSMFLRGLWVLRGTKLPKICACGAFHFDLFGSPPKPEFLPPSDIQTSSTRVSTERSTPFQGEANTGHGLPPLSHVHPLVQNLDTI